MLRLALWLSLAGLLLIAAGWPLAARLRERRLHGANHSGCGLGRIGTGKPIDIDGKPEDAVLPVFTTYECEDGRQTLWNKVQ